MPILALQPYGNITNVIVLSLIEHLHIYFIYILYQLESIQMTNKRFYFDLILQQNVSLEKVQNLRPGGGGLYFSASKIKPGPLSEAKIP